jgi:phenylpropionate dioxygenase-like ring-hydroxylating dioxygenase large terminal subunit
VSLPSAGVLRAAKVANQALADRTTPFVQDEWYVAGFKEDFARTLRKRKILGRNLVLFRTESGIPVALDDRCAHRSFPLSRSTLDGDTIVCGYHGLRYDSQGNCIEVPSQAKCPRGIGVRNFPLVEKGPLVWIWMGDPEQADAGRIADQSWLASDQWTRSQGYFSLPASYVSLHENLMDLTHLSYLHAASFGTADYAKAPYEATIEADRFVLHRRVEPTTLPPVWAEPTGIKGNTAARIVDSEFVSPALHVVTARFLDTRLPQQERREFMIKTAHIPTPETLTSTHYFIVHGRNFALQDDSITRFMHEQLFQAFAEDVDGLSAIEAVLAEAGDEVFEISVASDRASVAMRRYLKQRADRCGQASDEPG